MTSLTDLLLATQDPSRRAAAEAQIKQAEQTSVEQYFTALAQELANEEKPVIPRQLSGLLLKNGLAAKDPTRDRELKQRWVSLPLASRNLVKEATTKALISPHVDVGKAAAQVLAKVGAIEMPRNEWPQLVELLLSHIQSPDLRPRQISQTTLGYLCEELVILQEEGVSVSDEISNKILTAVVQGMRETDMATKLEATRAFYHTVLLAQRNMAADVERDVIMEVLLATCNTTGQMGADVVQTAAFECLVQVATEYYDHLLKYMNIIGPLTWETIKNSNEKVAIPAMEFWSTVCDEELDLMDNGGQVGQRRSLNLINQALPFLVPLLTECLTRQQSEDDDDNTQNIAMAAGTCLGLVAQVSGDACVDVVLGFVQQNFGHQDWKYREAAILAYGSIMEGPTSEKMRPLVEQSFQQLMVQALKDSSVAVRDTLAWTLGRMAQFHPSIVPIQVLTPLLAERLNDVPRVAVNVCWVIQVLAEAQPQCTMVPAMMIPPTGPLSEYFTVLVQQLLQATARPDATERNLRMAAYNSLSVLVSHSANDCIQHMERLVQEMLQHLTASFQKGVDRECELQGYICGVLTALTHRLRDKILPAAELLMQEALKVMQLYQQVRGGANVLQEEALLLIGALITATGPNFNGFMTAFAPYLKAGLENYEETQVCLLATGMIGDLCGALKGQMVQYCEPILQILYTNLRNRNVDRKIKSVIIECFGDIALAITGEFEKCLGPVVQMLQEASATRLQDGPAQNEEWIEYLNSLRESVLGAYAGIIHGLREAGKLHLFKEHVNAILNFVKDICDDPTVTEPVMKASLGVIGDLILVFQQELMMHLQSAPFLSKLVEFAVRSQDPGIRQTGQWLTSLVQKYSAPH
mmetsp:Transcript_55137/g.102102  ORF Transcript_55137/g.102102 Transcript_55137/m.102102 type:complete len:866 (+) Transcript_55137:475-3072(+)